MIAEQASVLGNPNQLSLKHCIPQNRHKQLRSGARYEETALWSLCTGEPVPAAAVLAQVECDLGQAIEVLLAVQRAFRLRRVQPSVSRVEGEWNSWSSETLRGKAVFHSCIACRHKRLCVQPQNRQTLSCTSLGVMQRLC